MDKQELLDHLDAICDAEGIIMSCQDSLELYSNYKCNLLRPSMPILPSIPEPVPRKVPVEPTNYKYNLGIGCLTSVFLYIAYCFLIGTIFNTNSDSAMFVCLVMALVSPPVITFILNKLSFQRKQAAHNKLADDDFLAAQKKYSIEIAQAQIEYEKQTTVYRKKLEIYNATISMFDLAAKKQEANLHAAQDKLKSLYETKVIYPTFQNLIAIYQIREYLKMGICETLEGPTGAYAQYMLDVHTQKICTSINDMKDSIVSSIKTLGSSLWHMQGALVQEIQKTTHSLDEMRTTISSDLYNLSSDIKEMNSATTSQLDEYFSHANKQLARIGDNIATSAHNQYIEQCLRNVDTYLLRAPTK